MDRNDPASWTGSFKRIKTNDIPADVLDQSHCLCYARVLETSVVQEMFLCHTKRSPKPNEIRITDSQGATHNVIQRVGDGKRRRVKAVENGIC
jgi:hypothetical protein